MVNFLLLFISAQLWKAPGYTKTEVIILEEMHLCISDLLDEDLSSFEFFQTLSAPVKERLLQADVRSFSQLQQAAQQIAERLGGMH